MSGVRAPVPSKGADQGAVALVAGRNDVPALTRDGFAETIGGFANRDSMASQAMIPNGGQT